MGKHALLFAIFTALSVILCSAALTSESAADCAEHFNSIYKVKKKTQNFKTTYLCYLLSSQYNFHDMTGKALELPGKVPLKQYSIGVGSSGGDRCARMGREGVVARKSWLINKHKTSLLAEALFLVFADGRTPGKESLLAGKTKLNPVTNC